jgi:predicted enzyme related to lactoylglutathione lyase
MEMTSRVTGVVIDCADPARLAAFWSQVLGYRSAGEPEFAWLETPEGMVALGFQRVPEGKVVKNRVHVDLTPADASQADEVARLLDLGARHADVGQGPDVSWVVMADPEGNEFCVLRPPNA